MADARRARPTIRVQAAVGGWPHPWPNVEELARVLPAHQWTLIGRPMTQLHAINRGIGVVRPTNDVDIVVHIETSRGVKHARTALATDRPAHRSATARPTGPRRLIKCHRQRTMLRSVRRQHDHVPTRGTKSVLTADVVSVLHGVTDRVADMVI